MITTNRGTHWTAEDVAHRLSYAVLPSDLVERAVIHLAEVDTVWNPASTKRPISGPGRVEFTRHRDGGVTAVVTQP